MLLGSSLLIILIKPISTILFGDDFYEAWRFAPFLLISVIFGALIGFLESISIANKKTKVLFTTTLFGASIGIVLNVLFIPLYGAIVASFSSTISYLSIFIYLHIYTKKSIKLNINFFKDSLSYILIAFESLSIIFIDSDISYYLATVCIVIILIINFKYLIELITLAKSFVKRKININK
jgi:O-antigen/teichoic acid export membrane protein